MEVMIPEESGLGHAQQCPMLSCPKPTTTHWGRGLRFTSHDTLILNRKRGNYSMLNNGTELNTNSRQTRMQETVNKHVVVGAEA